jgi:hypothetical protein
MEGPPRFLFGCCAVGVGDAEGRCLLGAIASEGEQSFCVSYQLVLGCDAFVDEESAVFGFVWACGDGGDGVTHGWCSGEAERDVASVDDCGWVNVSVCATGAQWIQPHDFQREVVNGDAIPSVVLVPTLIMNGTLLSPQSRKGPVISKL